MRMWVYIIRRILLVIPVVIGVMTITFTLTSQLTIDDRIISAYGENPHLGLQPYIPCTQAGIDQPGLCKNPFYWRAVHQLGLDQPVPVQWGIYMFNSLTFNWGSVDNKSIAVQSIPVAQGQKVTTVLGWLLPYTIELAFISLAIIIAISVPLGNLSAVYRNRPIDQASRVISFSGFALSTFLLGSLALMGIVLLLGPIHGWASYSCSGQSTFSDFYGSWPSRLCFAGQQYPSWLKDGIISSPTGFPTVDAIIHGQYWLALNTLERIIIPALIIAFGTIAVLLRFVRNSMLEVMNLDFVRTARAKGVPESTVIKRHAGRNSLNVTITVLGLTFAGFVGGFPVIEDVFNLNGVGRILAYSVEQPYDYGLIFGATLLFTFLVVAANIIVDVLYAYLDPRVRLG
ncbi:MAG: ABC transporter permease [Thermoplasmata archaeon]|jgi:peptide/nickel transport system permease protein